MKKRLRNLLLGAAVVLVVAGAVGGWLGYRAMYGTERISSSTAIPKPSGSPGPIEKGQADWPYWRGPQGDGRSPVTGIKTDWSGGLQRLWQVEFLCQGSDAATWSSPVVQGNRLVVPGRGPGQDLVFCLDPATGALIWLGQYEAKAVPSHGPGARATPCVDGDRVYTFGRSGDLACWNLQDGTLLWRHNVSDAGGKEPTWGHSSSPLVCGNRVIVQGGGEALVIAYDKMTGRVIWKAGQGPAGYAACALDGPRESPRLLVFHGTGLSSLDPSSGRQIWQVPWQTSYQVNATTPIVADDVVFITSGYGSGCEALKVSDTGEEVMWRSKIIASHHSDPILVDGFLYGYSGQSDQNSGLFKCVELSSGKERWATGEMGWGTAVWADGHLLCMDIKGNLFLVKPSPDAWHKVAEFRGALGPVTNPAWTIPVVANGRLYLRYMQRLVCYKLAQ
jgi:outer membrane protein assembly factor BamB